MARKRNPDDIVNLKVRFTEAMRARIDREAKKNNRSLNSEIVHRLGISFGADGVELANQYEQVERVASERLRELIEPLIEEAKRRNRESNR